MEKYERRSSRYEESGDPIEDTEESFEDFDDFDTVEEADEFISRSRHERPIYPQETERGRRGGRRREYDDRYEGDDRYEDDDSYEDDDYDEDDRRRGFHISVPLILLLVILVIAAVAVVRFLIWNKGQSTGYDPDAVDTQAFSVEVQDFIVPLTEEAKAAQTDDGKTTILFLGNDVLCDDTSDTGIAQQIAQISGAEVIIAAIPGSRVTCLNYNYDPSTPEGMDDVFNLYFIANAIGMKEFSALEVVSGTKEDSRYADAVQTLETIDYSTIDHIVIMYDSIDYKEGAPVSNDNADDITSYAGALKQAIQLIQNAYPGIRITFMSPTYETYYDADGNAQNPALYDFGNGEITGYNASAIIDCSTCGISYIDNFGGSVNAINYKKFTNEDGTGLNDAGKTEVAKHFCTKIIDNDYTEWHPVSGD